MIEQHDPYGEDWSRIWFWLIIILVGGGVVCAWVLIFRELFFMTCSPMKGG